MSQEQRKILVIGADAWARDTIRVLLGSMGCQCVLASSIREALPLLDQEQLDAAIVDEQAGNSGGPELPGIEEICGYLGERVVVLTGGSQVAKNPGALHGWWLPRIPRSRLVQDLWGVLNSLLRPRGVFHRVVHAARLIFDSILEPVPAGIRAWKSADRRFVYEAGSLVVDLAFEPQAGSNRVVLIGQIVDSVKPTRRLGKLRVVLLGRTGRLGAVATDEFGEFRVDFNQEPGINLEIETATNEFVSIILPSLGAEDKKAKGATSPAS